MFPYQLLKLCFGNASFAGNPGYLDKRGFRRYMGIKPAAGCSYHFGRNVFRRQIGTMHQERVDAFLHGLQVFFVGRSFVSAARTGGIVIPGGGSCPEIPLLLEQLSYALLTHVASVEAQRYSITLTLFRNRVV